MGDFLPEGKDAARKVIAAAGLNPQVRGEELTLEQFAILAELIYNISGNCASSEKGACDR
jgi:ribosomal protein S13